LEALAEAVQSTRRDWDIMNRSSSIIGLFGFLCACGSPSSDDDELGIENESDSETDSSGDTTTTTETGGSDSETETETGSLVDCAGQAGLAPGNHSRTLEHDGLQRAYTIHVPGGLDPEVGAPLLLNLHGFMSNPIQQEQWTAMNATADPRGWITVYPTGTDNSWNAGACCGEAVSNGVDDVGFLRAVVEAVADELCVDPARVHATGMSNGGYMSNRLGCEASDVFASIAPVAGALGVFTCTPPRPVAVLAMHGVQDPLVGYGLDEATVAAWVGHDGCDPASEQIDFVGGNQQIWSGCDDDVAVEFYTLDPMGHCWPSGSSFYCFDFLGPYSDAIDANVTMLDFFDLHSMP
jgi:polyhydroxybutyrate depolymerase